MSIITGARDFVKGIVFLVRGSRGIKAEGDKKLAYLSRIINGQIDMYGTRAVRTQVIKSIEGDLKRMSRKGEDEVEKRIQNALSTPDYMKMLHRLGLEEPHLRVMAMQALKRR